MSLRNRENSAMAEDTRTGDVNRNEVLEDVILTADGGNAAVYEVNSKAKAKRFHITQLRIRINYSGLVTSRQCRHNLEQYKITGILVTI